MPHVSSGSSGGGDDLASTDEVKVYKDEGEEIEQRSSEKALNEEKLGLLTETEQGGKSSVSSSFSSNASKDSPAAGLEKALNGLGNAPMSLEERAGHLGYFFPHYPYSNGALLPPGSLGGKGSAFMPGAGYPSPLSWMYGNGGESLPSPPPAHLGMPPMALDPKTGMPRHMYPFSSGPLSPFFSESQWRPPVYSLGGPSSYMMPRFSSHPFAALGGPGISHPALVPPSSPHQHPFGGQHSQDASMGHRSGSLGEHSHKAEEKKKPHVKKPLNAFMLFMKDMRSKVVAECTLKESAAINQILGRKWHELDRGEQAKYYEMARQERLKHMQQHPGWSARDNYGLRKKRKKKREKPQGENGECINQKKCRARFGLDQQNQWCKHCKRKKKCIRFTGSGASEADSDSECGSSHIDDDDEDDDDEHPDSTSLQSPDPSCTSSPMKTVFKGELNGNDAALMNRNNANPEAISS